MFKNYIKTALRNLLRNKTYTFINIAGFAFAMSICLAIAVYLIHEHSYDQYHVNSSHIYRVTDAENNSSSIDYRVKDILTSLYPEVENASLFLLLPESIPLTIENRGTTAQGLASVDRAFFEMFSIPFVQGNAENPLPDLQSVVITKSTANQLFGGLNPVGQVILISNELPVTVSGVISDFPSNSSISADVFVNADNDNFKFSVQRTDSDDLSTYRWLFNIYTLLGQDADSDALVQKINQRANDLQPYLTSIDLLPLEHMYLHDSASDSLNRHGNPILLQLLTGIGLIILLLAIVNHVNLTLAQQKNRMGEIGVKKSLGASRKDILFQFLTESVMLTLIAFCIALIVLDISDPWYRYIFYEDYTPFLLIGYIHVIVPCVLFVGIISGLSNAYTIASIHPVQAIKRGKVSNGRRVDWRRGLTVFQFIVSIALLVCVIVIQQQLSYVKQRDPGFDENQLLKINAPRIQEADLNALNSMLVRLRQGPGIESVSLSNGVPGHINWSGPNTAVEGKGDALSIIVADSAFVQTFGIEISQGRLPLDSDYGTTSLINEAAYQYFEWQDIENKVFTNGGSYNVIGVVNDFQYSSLKNTIGPLVILLSDDVSDRSPSHITVKIAPGQVGSMLNFIRNEWQEVLSQYEFQYEFYDAWLAKLYIDDDRLRVAITLFALLAIVISCLGTLGMVVSSTQRRKKEIGIRKVLGASVSQVVTLLSKEFLLLVLSANIIAWPIAWYVMNRWLQDFAYKIELGPGVFVLAGLLALGVVLVTVSWQSIKAALMNPVNSLRSE